MTSPYDDDLALALALADDADAISLPRFGAGDLIVESKPDLTPVSDADKAVELAIRRRLGDARPRDAVIGEEFGGGVTRTRQWVIDPIDGTKSFVRGVPVWATLIALLVEGTAVCGVVSAPALARRWWAADGAGAWTTFAAGDARRLGVSAVSRLSDASVSYSSPTGWAASGRREGFDRLLAQVWRSRAYGDFWSYMLVAEGAVDAAAEPELALWDVAALAPIVREAGGRFSGLNGVDGVQEGDAVASNGLLHEALLATLNA